MGRYMEIKKDMDLTIFNPLKDNTYPKGTYVKFTSSYGTIILDYDGENWNTNYLWFR